MSDAPPDTPHGRSNRRRLISLGVLVLVVLAIYVLLLSRFTLVSLPTEQKFGLRPGAAELTAYVSTLSVDPLRETLQLRVTIKPGTTMLGRRPTVPDRDITVVVTDADSVEERVFPANQEMEPAEVGVDFVTGHVADFPFDHYRVPLVVQAFEGRPPDLGREIATRVTFWGHLSGFTVAGTVTPTVEGHGVSFQVDLRRNGLLVWFTCIVYLATLLMSLCGLMIGAMVFLGKRQVEAGLISATTAVIFAVVTLRNAMPGAPPLGVLADMLVFMWVEVFAVAGLVMVVYVWMTETPKI